MIEKLKDRQIWNWLVLLLDSFGVGGTWHFLIKKFIGPKQLIQSAQAQLKCYREAQIKDVNTQASQGYKPNCSNKEEKKSDDDLFKFN